MIKLKKLFSTRKRILAFILAIVVALTTIASSIIIVKVVKDDKSTSSSDYNFLLLEANNAFDNGNYEEALDYINQCIDINDKSPELYAFRAKVYYSLNRPKDALTDYKKIIAMEPDNKDYLLAYIYLNVELEYYEDALDSLLTLIDLEPDNKDYYALAGDLYIYLEDYEDASNYYEQAVALSDNPTKDYKLFTSYYKTKGDLDYSKASYSSAYNYYDSYISTINDVYNAGGYTYTEQDYEVYFNHGLCSIQIDQFETGYNDFTFLISQDYAIDLSYFQRGLCYYSLNKFDLALNDLNLYLKSHPESSDPFLYMAISYYELGDYVNSHKYFSECLKNNIYLQESYYFLGIIAIDMSDYDDAITYLTKATVYPDYADSSIFNRGVAYVHMNNLDLAKKDFEYIVDHSTDSSLISSAKSVIEEINNSSDNSNIVIEGDNITIINGEVVRN